VNREKVPGSTITVVIADDDPIVRRVLTQVLEAEPGFAVLASEPDSERAVDTVTKLKPDILLVDLFLPKVASVHVAVSYRSASTRPVIMCSTFEQRSVLDALERGAVGVWMKEDLDNLAECLRCVASGSYWNRTHESPDIVSMFREVEAATSQSVSRLTSREQEVVLLTSSGMTTREIGERLDIQKTTVQRHLTNMFDKLGMRNRGELTRFVLEHGLISPPLGGKPQRRIIEES
jgi:DNA-binding NarL/FixJ family response regulator